MTSLKMIGQALEVRSYKRAFISINQHLSAPINTRVAGVGWLFGQQNPSELL